MGVKGKNLKQNSKSRNQEKKNHDSKTISNISSLVGLDKYKICVVLVGMYIFSCYLRLAVYTIFLYS